MSFRVGKNGQREININYIINVTNGSK